MANLIDQGEQILSHRYSSPAKAVIWNQLSYNIIPAGIYNGGLLTKASDVAVVVSPFTAILYDPDYVQTDLDGLPIENTPSTHDINGIAIRVQTQSAVTITGPTFNEQVTPAQPYIVGEYTWAESAENYVRIFSTDLATIESNPSYIIFGRAQFDGTEMLSDFDYTRRTESVITIQESRKDALKVTPTIDDAGIPANNVRVNAGTFSFNNSYYVLENDTVSASSAPDNTQARIDLVVIDYTATPMEVGFIQGTEHTTPVVPEYPINRFTVAEIHRPPNSNDIDGSMIVPVLDVDGYSLTNLPWSPAGGRANSSIIPLGDDGISKVVTGQDTLTIPASTMLPTVFRNVIDRVIDATLIENGAVNTLQTDATVAATSDKLIKRDGDGRAKIANPDDTADIANKGYVDTKSESEASVVQGNLSTHINTETSGVHGATADATANKIIIRDAHGRAKIANPDDTADIANKEYVDNQIGGRLTASQNATITGSWTFNQTLNATAFNATSSRKAKKDIQDFSENAIDLINGIKVVKYKYKVDEEDKDRVGFIADDTDPLLSGSKQDRFDIGTTVGVLLKALQESHNTVKSLEKRIELLEKNTGVK